MWVLYTFFETHRTDEKDEKNFNPIMFIVCLFLGFIISLAISYLSLPEDKILTTNFWD